MTGGEQPRYFRIPRDGDVKDETIRTVLLDGDKEAVGKILFPARRPRPLDRSQPRHLGL
ncbi:hypothetical protein [Rhizobium yanglingense]